MGDRFYLILNCAYCSTVNKDVYYAPTCDFYDFKCQKCNRTNFITADFSVKRVEDVVIENVVAAFEMATTAVHSADSIRGMAKRYLRELKKHGRAESGTADTK